MGIPSSRAIKVQLVSIVGVKVGVAVSVGASDVGLLVSVEGKGVTDGNGVNVCVGVRCDVFDGIKLAVGVQVGGSATGLL